jgi:aspartate/methionine/tyrosine aminotransferase
MAGELTTDRLLLRQWRDADLDPWAAMNADPGVREFVPETLTRPGDSVVMSPTVYPLDCVKLGADEARGLFLERGRVAMEPDLCFGAAGAGHVRLNFGTSAEILDEATTRMAAAVAR